MSEFTMVSHKKKKKRNGKTINTNQYDENSPEFYERLKSRVLNAQYTVSNSDVYQTILNHLEESLKVLEQSSIPDVICYGLGNISGDQNARYQFGLVFELKKHFKSELLLYDPVFKESEIKLMKNLNCEVISFNEMGRRTSTRMTLFFLPHCPHEILNNVISANWGEKLYQCIIISNSIKEVCLNLPQKKIENDLPYLLKVLPFLVEFDVHNTFKPIGAFNDLSVHIFSKDKNVESLSKKSDLDNLTESINKIDI